MTYKITIELSDIEKNTAYFIFLTCIYDDGTVEKRIIIE